MLPFYGKSKYGFKHRPSVLDTEQLYLNLIHLGFDLGKTIISEQKLPQKA